MGSLMTDATDGLSGSAAPEGAERPKPEAWPRGREPCEHVWPGLLARAVLLLATARAGPCDAAGGALRGKCAA